MTTWFTTDTHFGHPLVSALRGYTRFDPGRQHYTELLQSQGLKAAHEWVESVVRDDRRLSYGRAADTEAHDEAIIENINSLVQADDILWILGDLGYRTSIDHLADCMNELNCQNIRVILGNHDGWWKNEPKVRDRFLSVTANDATTISGIGVVNLSHFPYREALSFGWSGDERFANDALSRNPYDGDTPLLYGHTHQLTPDGPDDLQVNVGLDAWNLMPVSNRQVVDWFANRNVL